MTPPRRKEATEAPIDHIKMSKALQTAILEKLCLKQALAAEKAVSEAALELTDAEKQLFRYLVLKGVIVKIEKDSQEYFFLSKEFHPLKDYRKEVVMGFSISILIFLLLLLAVGLGAIVISVIAYLKGG